MPPTKRGYQNMSGVLRQTADGVFYADGRYLCQRVENGIRCNRQIAATRHSISSHNSDFHTPGRYQQLMARGDYECIEDGCNHKSMNFQAILAHIRGSHNFKGSSDPLKAHYGLPVSTKTTKRKRGDYVKGNRCKKNCNADNQHSPQKTLPTIKEDDREDTREEPIENLQENDGQESEDNRDGDNDYLDLIDPRLRKWDEDNGGSGNGGAGSGGSSLGGQLLSSNVIAASG
ncbi:hypothetical protein F4859DRAFT_117765 [Xylaria cf. heliscus]|nr:hypothetical protein F4859DRAFT_117765 [Xylaria cf. heliscus]